MSADPVVSPADTIRSAQRCEETLAGEFASTSPSDRWKQEDVYTHVYLPLAGHLLRICDLATALLAVGERDRQQIARLTEALERLVNEGYLLVPAANGLIRYAEAAKSDTKQGHRPEGAIEGYDQRRESFATAVNVARAVLAGEEDARP